MIWANSIFSFDVSCYGTRFSFCFEGEACFLCDPNFSTWYLTLFLPRSLVKPSVGWIPLLSRSSWLLSFQEI